MSRIGKQLIALPSGAELKVDGNVVTAKGPKGESSFSVPDYIKVSVEDGNIAVVREVENKRARAMHGTCRSLISNMIEGVLNGYTKELELHGVGFRAALQGRVLNLALGYSHPINFQIPEGLTITVDKNTDIVITGVDKQVVGQAAAQIRAYYKAEPYKGKGVRYKNEKIRRKVGKAVA
jgi:large subunit ribosomal protein L6